MKIIILGTDTVAMTLAAELCKEDHDIIVVDYHKEALQDLQETLDISTLHGHPSYPDVLRQAGCEQADALIAISDRDEINMVACQVAYSLFHVPIKLARIRSPHYFIRNELFGNDNLPIDLFINPEQLITQAINLVIQHPATQKVIPFANQSLHIIVLNIQSNSPVIGKTVNTLGKNNFFVINLYRDNHVCTDLEDIEFQAGDEVTIACHRSVTDRVGHLFNPDATPYHRIIIAGGGYVGHCLAKTLEEDYHVKVIEHKIETCERISKTLGQTTVLHGDASDRSLLLSENIKQTDLYCAMTNDDEVNILSSLQAKYLGAKKVLTLINQSHYIDILEKGLIDNTFSPQQVTASFILSHLKKNRQFHMHTLRADGATVIEITLTHLITPNRIIGKDSQKIKLPPKCVIAAIVRGHDVFLGTTAVDLQESDRIILFSPSKSYIKEIEKLFGLT